jgi:hypothetical protein
MKKTSKSAPKPTAKQAPKQSFAAGQRKPGMPMKKQGK